MKMDRSEGDMPPSNRQLADRCPKYCGSVHCTVITVFQERIAKASVDCLSMVTNQLYLLFLTLIFCKGTRRWVPLIKINRSNDFSIMEKLVSQKQKAFGKNSWLITRSISAMCANSAARFVTFQQWQESRDRYEISFLKDTGLRISVYIVIVRTSLIVYERIWLKSIRVTDRQ